MSGTLFDPEPAGTLGATGPVRSAGAPLAVRLRPQQLGDVLGQEHLLQPGSPLRQLIEPRESEQPARAVSVMLWGPPGTGKTTLASLISQASGRRYVELSAVNSGVKEVREVIEQAKNHLARTDQGTVLFIDEVHRFNKTQQDALLPAVENGWVTLIAATTENPSFSVVAPLLSRSVLLTLKPLTEQDLASLIRRAVAVPEGLNGLIAPDDEAVQALLRLAGGDARRLLTSLEAAADAALAATAKRPAPLTAELVAQAVDRAVVRYDRDGDQHYDVISAFIKSVRGSDVDAALHYLARMIAAGEDPRFIARRLIILASEDIGLADPSALGQAVAAADAVAFLGMPEGRIPLGQATVALALAPKSNASYLAIDAALADVRVGRIGQVPPHLRDAHYAGAKKLGHGKGYQYSHNEPNGIAAQQYAPDELVEARYYHPTDRGAEKHYRQIVERTRAVLHGEPTPTTAETKPDGEE